MLLFVLIILVNAYFVVTWLIYISPVIVATLREKWPIFTRFSKQYRIRPHHSSAAELKEPEKSDISSNSLGVMSSSQLEGTFQAVESIVPPANTPTRLGRENTDREDPGLAREYSLR